MRGLELLAPSGLWLLAGLVPLIAMYVLKIRRERVKVPSTWLWAAAQRDLLAKRPFKRLERELPLLLEILALAALALALSRPATRGGAIAGDHVAIVIDTSASMGAVSRAAGGADSTRMEEAKAAARDVVARLAPGADAFVVEAGHDARPATALERDRRALEAAIAKLEPREVEGTLASAVALAADRLRALPGARRIVVITDGALADARGDGGAVQLATGGVDAQVILVGSPAQNAAIVRVDVRSGADPKAKREETQVFAMLESFGDRPSEAYVTLSLEGRSEPLASRRVALPPGSKTPVVLAFEPRHEDEGAGLVVRIAPDAKGDALAADDAAYARVPAGRRMPVVLASPPGARYSWIGRALASDADVELRTIDVGDLAGAGVEPDALVVVEGACPERLPGRDVLVVGPPEGACLGVQVGKVVDAPRVTSWETGDPRLRFLTLDGVHVARARALEARGALVRSERATLMADASLPGRAATVLGFDVGESDWPLQASFVLFVRNVVELSRSHRAQGAAAPARTGEPIRIAVPPEVRSVSLEGPPPFAPIDVAASEGFAILPALDRAGIYRARWREPHVGEVVLPVNLTSEAESDLRPRPIVLAGGGASAVAPRVPDAHHEWGAWLALFAALVLVAEAAWLTRRARARTPLPSPAPRTRRAVALVAALAVAPLAYQALVQAGALRETYLRFGVPAALLAVAGAGLVLAWRLARLPARMGSARKALVSSLVTAAVLGAALAAAEPEIGRPLDRLTVLVAVDRSRSIDLVPGADARVSAELALASRGMRAEDRVATLVFGAEAAIEDPPRPRSELAPAQRVEVGRDGTDLEGAIRRALAEVPADSAARVVLVTDGVETRGDALGATSAAIAAGVPIDAVLLEQKPAKDVRLVTVRAPSRAGEGEPIELRVVTQSAVATDLEIRVTRDGEPLHATRARVQAGEDVLRLREIAAEPGLHRYDVAVTALDPSADSSPEDNAGSAFVKVRGPALALILEGDPGKGAPLGDALRGAGFLTREASTTGVPADVGGLVGYDLVVLSDVRASDLASSQLDALASYARDLGGGLLLLGGDRSMGPGGYARTPVEEVSPVGFDLRAEKRRASLAEVIAIDYSGSMGITVGGQTKLALANEAAARSASLLGPGDRLGVEHVDTVVRWTVPVGPVDDPRAIGSKIRAVSVGGGGIYTDLALDAAYAALERETVNLKHLLLFADGDDAEQIAGCRARVKAAASRGITTSVISLGKGSDSPELEVLSKIGGGRFYLIDDATKLPAVFTQETVLATRSALDEHPFRASLGAPSAATRGIDFGAAPPLGGYVVTVPKARATVGLTGPDGDPVLAAWSVGLGRAAAFTSDYKDRWGRGWLGWPGGAKTMGQLGRDTARKEDDPRVRLESDTSGGELHVRADVVGDDGRAQTFRRLSVHVAGPDGLARDLPLEAVGAGRYAASVPLTRPGTYVATAKDDATGELVGTTGAALTPGEELRPTGSDRALLARLAQLTGGKMRDTLAGVFDDRAARRFAYTPLAPLLTLVAGVALLLAVGARRLGVPDAALALAARLRAARSGRAGRTTARIWDEGARVAEQARVQEQLLARKRAAPPPKAAAAPSFVPPSPPPVAPPPPQPSLAAPEAAPPPAERELTAAERLALRRRQRR